MEVGAAVALAGLLVGQFSLIWYRLGKLEQRLTDHISRSKLLNPGEGQHGTN